TSSRISRYHQSHAEYRGESVTAAPQSRNGSVSRTAGCAPSTLNRTIGNGISQGRRTVQGHEGAEGETGGEALPTWTHPSNPASSIWRLSSPGPPASPRAISPVGKR